MDQVFDSVNGSDYDATDGKFLRCAVKTGSPHLKFWVHAVDVFKSVKCITPKGETVPPSVKNWVKTLRGFIYIWKKLNGIGFKYLCPRNINQDPLENFFGCIRSHGVRNINPTCYSFISSFKSLIINNFASPHSPGANCEADDYSILDPLKSLLVNSRNDIGEGDDVKIYNCNLEFENVEDTAIISNHAYIAGYIAKNIKKKLAIVLLV